MVGDSINAVAPLPVRTLAILFQHDRHSHCPAVECRVAVALIASLHERNRISFVDRG